MTELLALMSLRWYVCIQAGRTLEVGFHRLSSSHECYHYIVPLSSFNCQLAGPSIIESKCPYADVFQLMVSPPTRDCVHIGEEYDTPGPIRMIFHIIIIDKTPPSAH